MINSVFRSAVRAMLTVTASMTCLSVPMQVLRVLSYAGESYVVFGSDAGFSAALDPR